jgi:hypothetical protein
MYPTEPKHLPRDFDYGVGFERTREIRMAFAPDEPRCAMCGLPTILHRYGECEDQEPDTD